MVKQLKLIAQHLEVAVMRFVAKPRVKQLFVLVAVAVMKCLVKAMVKQLKLIAQHLQLALDLALKARVPFVHFLDGFRTPYEIQSFETLSCLGEL